MKMIDHYMNILYKMELVEDLAEGGYIASFPELKGCLTSTDTVEHAMAMTNDAKREWLEAGLEDGYPIPDPHIG